MAAAESAEPWGFPKEPPPCPCCGAIYGCCCNERPHNKPECPGDFQAWKDRFYAPEITSKTVKRYFWNGKGYANKYNAYLAIARKQLLVELEVECGQYTGPESEFSQEFQGRYWIHDTTYDGEILSDGWFDGPGWFADIQKRAKELLTKDTER